MPPGAANVKPISIPTESDRIEIGLTFVVGRVEPVFDTMWCPNAPQHCKKPMLGHAWVTFGDPKVFQIGF